MTRDDSLARFLPYCEVLAGRALAIPKFSLGNEVNTPLGVDLCVRHGSMVCDMGELKVLLIVLISRPRIYRCNW